MVCCVASTVTPLALLALIFGAKSYGLIGVYFVFGILGTSYNPRASTAYLYGAEMLPVNKRLKFGSVLFFIDGIFSICAAYYFYKFKSINTFFIAVLCCFTTAWLILAIFLPETPSFLLMRGDIPAYNKSLAKMTG